VTSECSQGLTLTNLRSYWDCSQKWDIFCSRGKERFSAALRLICKRQKKTISCLNWCSQNFRTSERYWPWALCTLHPLLPSATTDISVTVSRKVMAENVPTTTLQICGIIWVITVFSYFCKKMKPFYFFANKLNHYAKIGYCIMNAANDRFVTKFCNNICWNPLESS